MAGRPAHCWGDLRLNGFPTIPGPYAQPFVRINGRPWAVMFDTTPVGGFLLPGQFFVRIDGAPVTLCFDYSTPDMLYPVTHAPQNFDPMPLPGLGSFVTVLG